MSTFRNITIVMVMIFLFASQMLLAQSRDLPANRAGATRPAAPTDSSPAQARSDFDAALIDKLDRTIVDAAYDRLDFDKIIDDLRLRFDMNVHVNWSVLEAVGVKRDKRIDLRLNRIPLATLIDFILVEAAAGATDSLAYHVRNGILFISTQEALSRQTVLRTYDVTDLLPSGYATRRFANTPILRLRRAGGESAGGVAVGGAAEGGALYGSGGGGKPADLAEAPAMPANFVDIQSLIDLITQNVEPESWRTSGGSIGSISTFNASLIVGQTMRAQRQIEDLLATLRRASPVSLDADAMIVHMSAPRAAAWRQSVGASFPRMSADAIRTLTADNNVTTLFRAATSGRNGERMWLSALTQRTMLTGATPIMADNVWSTQPLVETVDEGLELVLLPMMSPDATSLVIDIQMALSPTVEIHERVVALGPAAPGIDPNSASTQPVATGDAALRIARTGGAVSATLDLPVRRMRTASATVRAADGEFIALSIPATPTDGGASTETEDWLLVRVRRSGK